MPSPFHPRAGCLEVQNNNGGPRCIADFFFDDLFMAWQPVCSEKKQATGRPVGGRLASYLRGQVPRWPCLRHRLPSAHRWRSHRAERSSPEPNLNFDANPLHCAFSLWLRLSSLTSRHRVVRRRPPGNESAAPCVAFSHGRD